MCRFISDRDVRFLNGKRLEDVGNAEKGFKFGRITTIIILQQADI